MVTLTMFTVGYGEVHPIDTPFLHALTMSTMVFGCTGVIFFTGALVQFFTLSPLQQILGVRRVHTEVDKLTGHVIVCGYGRIGVALAKALRDGGTPFVILEQNDRRAPRRVPPGIFACRPMPPAKRRSWMPASIGRASSLPCYPTTRRMYSSH
ncbi:MAG: NAD-binding protein [Actinomycetota bacterium]